MPDHKIFDELVQKLAEHLPSDLAQDCQAKFREILSATFNRLDLVTREEFDAQKQVLTRTRALLEDLEKKLTDLEKN